MGESNSSLKTYPHISPKPVIAILAALGLVFILVGDPQPDPAYRRRLLCLAVLLYAASLTAWGLDSWKPWIGRWFVVGVLLAIVHLGSIWLSVSGLLTLLVISIVLAVALISLAAGTLIAISETMLLVILPEVVAARMSADEKPEQHIHQGVLTQA